MRNTGPIRSDPTETGIGGLAGSVPGSTGRTGRVVCRVRSTFESSFHPGPKRREKEPVFSWLCGPELGKTPELEPVRFSTKISRTWEAHRTPLKPPRERGVQGFNAVRPSSSRPRKPQKACAFSSPDPRIPPPSPGVSASRTVQNMSRDQSGVDPVQNRRVTWEGCSVLLDINDGDRLVFSRLTENSWVSQKF